MEEKKFDSPEKIMEVSNELKIAPTDLYFSFIDVMYTYLSDRLVEIHGAPAEDFFVQGLIAITAHPEKLKDALEKFMNILDMKY